MIPGTHVTLLELQYRFGDNPLKFQVVYPQNGTSVLKGLIYLYGFSFPVHPGHTLPAPGLM